MSAPLPPAKDSPKSKAAFCGNNIIIEESNGIWRPRREGVPYADGATELPSGYFDAL